MRFIPTIALAALLRALPSLTSNGAGDGTQAALADFKAAGVQIHCNLSPSMDLNAIFANFDTMAQHSPGGLCGGVVAPMLTVGGRQSAQASADAKTKFYVCNQSDKTRCISLGADKRTLLQFVYNQCKGKAFWIQESDEWSYGVDPIDNPECGF
jgi:hypothetical protein